MRATRRTSWLLTVLAVACATVFPCSSPVRAEAYWFEDYEKTVRLIDKGQHDDAIVLLRTVIQAQSSPVASLRVPGNRYIDYFPYYQRARIQLGRGDIKAASHSLDVSEAFGAVMRDRHTWSEFVKLRERIDAIATPDDARNSSSALTSVARIPGTR